MNKLSVWGNFLISGSLHLCLLVFMLSFCEESMVVDRERITYSYVFLENNTDSKNLSDRLPRLLRGLAMTTRIKSAQSLRESIAIVKLPLRQDTARAKSSLRAPEGGAAIHQPHVVKYNELLKILHQHIAAKQVYPQKALQLNQSGKVVIEFLLTPKGQLHNIRLAASSGFEVIDQAALSAVQAITLVQGAGYYIKDPEIFKVAVIIE